MLKHVPKDVRSLVFVKIFTTYSFAVLYASLVLYMTSNLGFSKSSAMGIVGTFVSLNFLLHFLGGYAGGKYLSNRQLFVTGMSLEIIGLILFQKYLFLGLGIFLTGCVLYVTSINAIMIQKYKPEDPEREIASFWLYSGMNLGFFIGHSVSGYFYIAQDFKSLFVTAVIASSLSLVIALCYWDKFSDTNTEYMALNSIEQKRRHRLSLYMFFILIPFIIAALSYDIAITGMVFLTAMLIIGGLIKLAQNQQHESDRNKLYAFLILMVAGIIFWSLFFIGPMGLTLFIKNHVDARLFSISIPPQWFNNINTSIIVIGGPILAYWFKQKREEGKELSVPFLFSLALLFVGTAFAILPLGISISSSSRISLWWIIVSYILQTMGELFLSPVGVAMIGKLAPNGRQGLLLGIWSMVSGIASMLSKYFSQLMVMPGENSLVDTGSSAYSSVFSIVGWGAIGASIILYMFIPRIKKLMGESESNEVILDQDKPKMV